MIPAAAAAIRYAAMFAALGHEARVRIVRLVLAAHPDGLVAGEIQQELGIPASTLSHHLDALETAGLIAQRRQGTFLRYSAAAGRLRDLLGFLYAECCTRSEIGRASCRERWEDASRGGTEKCKG